MLGIIFLCEGQNSTYSHWQQCANLSRNSHLCWACFTKKLFSTCGVKILEKYLWRCTFFSKVACWRPATWLKLASLTGNFKGFWPQIQSSCKFYKRFLKKTFFAEHFTLAFSIFQLIYESFQSISILFWHPTAQQVSGIACCFLSPWNSSRFGISVYIWLPRNSACVLKHKQTWPEQAVYSHWRRSGVFIVYFEHIPHLVLVFLLLALSK